MPNQKKSLYYQPIMTESDSALKVFICGNSSIETVTGQNILKRAIYVVKKNDGIVLNEEEIAQPLDGVGLDILARYHNSLEQKMRASDCALSDITTGNRENLGQLWTYTNTSIGQGRKIAISAYEKRKHHLPTHNPNKIERFSWATAEEFDQNISAFLDAEMQRKRSLEREKLATKSALPLVLATGILRIVRNRRRVLCNGEDIKLSEYEYALLKPVAEQMGNLVSFEEITAQGRLLKPNEQDSSIRTSAMKAFSQINTAAKYRYILSQPKVGYTLISEPPAQVSEPIMITNDNLELDVSNQRIWFKDQWIYPGVEVYKLLLFLGTHPDQSFKKDELIEAVYGERIVQDVAFRALITRARKAVGEHGSNGKYVSFRREEGYKMSFSHPNVHNTE